ncbi:MAG: phenylacetate--CoA ligase family protein [Parcubacteria group bacterium]|nr:phenylacetate--CoA ligase family protein [Parcubacteria group bacterium]
MNPPEAQKEALAVLNGVLESNYSNFYRKKYKHCTKFDDWVSIPFLTRSEMQRTSFFDRLFIPLGDMDMVRPTSGTSGRGILLMPKWGKKPQSYKPPLHVKYIKQKSLNRAVTFSGAHSYYANDVRNRLGIDYLYLDPGDMQTSARLFNLYKPEIIYGFPYAIASLVSSLSEKSLAQKVQAIIFFGERCSDTQWRFIQKYFANAVIFSEYASIETQATIAGPCTEIVRKKEKYVHPLPDYVFFEIIDSSGETLTKEGASGELVITTISPVVFPLIRYRTGDSATIIYSSCPCSIKTPVISIDGRIEIDRLRIPGGELNLAEIERVVSQCQEYVTGGDFLVQYIEIKDRYGVLKPKVTIELSWNKKKKADSTVLAKIFAQTLRVAPQYTYADGVREGKYEPLTIQFLPQDTNMGKRRIIRN